MSYVKYISIFKKIKKIYIDFLKASYIFMREDGKWPSGLLTLKPGLRHLPRQWCRAANTPKCSLPCISLPPSHVCLSSLRTTSRKCSAAQALAYPPLGPPAGYILLDFSPFICKACDQIKGGPCSIRQSLPENQISWVSLLKIKSLY